MFNLQPGTGLGFSGAREMALGLGGVSVVVVIVPGGGIEDGGVVFGRRRRLREQEELELLILMVGVIEQDRDN